MTKTRIIGFTAAALVAGAAAASAGTITQTLTFSSPVADWTHTFSFDPFDPALGTLTEVTETFTQKLAGKITVTNIGATSTTFSALLTNLSERTFPGSADATTKMGGTAFGTLAPHASSGVLRTGGTSTESGSLTSGLSVFELGPVLGVVTNEALLTLASATGNATAEFSVGAEITDTLVYTFETPSVSRSGSDPISEPGALALLGCALAWLGWGHRRRRRAHGAG